MIRLLDTNAVIYWSNGYLDQEWLRGDLHYSVISRIELFSYPKLSSESKEGLRNLLRFLEEVPLTESIVEITIELRMKYRLKVPDAIIAATTVVLSAELITNDKTLLRLPGLRSRAVYETP